MLTPATAVLVAFCLLVIARLREMAVQPVVDYDSLAFHLPTMALWFQTGRLEMMEQFAHTTSLYPYNWEALCSLSLFPLREDFLVTLPNLVAWAILGLSIYLLSLELGAAATRPLLAATLVLCFPSVLHSLNTLHLDLPLAALFLAPSILRCATCAPVPRVSSRSSSPRVGLLLGVKSPGLGLRRAAASGPLARGCELVETRRRPTLPVGEKTGSLVVGLTCLLFSRRLLVSSATISSWAIRWGR